MAFFPTRQSHLVDIRLLAMYSTEDTSNFSSQGFLRGLSQ